MPQMHKERSHTQEKPVSSTLASVGLRLSDWFERWFPDAFALALAAVAVVFVASDGRRATRSSKRRSGSAPVSGISSPSRCRCR